MDTSILLEKIANLFEVAFKGPGIYSAQAVLN